MPTIETARLRLRPFAPPDLDLYKHRIYGDSEVMRYLPPGEPVSRERVAYALTRVTDHWRLFGHGLWAVEEISPADPGLGGLIGHCGLVHLEHTGEVEVAYALARDRWGRGYATEATIAALRFGFERLGLPRIVAIAMPENLASRRVMEKCGMRYERPAHHYGCDVVLYSLDSDRHRPNGAPYTLL